MKSLFRIAIIGFVVVAASSSTCRTKATTVTMLFDGGFMFVQHPDGSMSVVSPRESGQHHEARLKITSPSMETSYPLKDWNVSIDTGAGSSASGVTLPGQTPVQQSETDCTAIPKDTAAANNLSWLPDLNQLHPNQRLDLSPATIESRIQLKNGRLDVTMAHGCWQLRNAVESKRPQSLVYGDNSVQYVTQTAQATVTLTFTPLVPGAGSAFTVEIPAKDVSDVVIEVGYPRIPTKGTPVGQPMADFSRHYRLLPDVAGADRYLPVAKIDHGSGGPGSIPGRECGSVRFTEPATGIVRR